MVELHMDNDRQGNKVRVTYKVGDHITLLPGDTLSVWMNEADANRLLAEFLAAIAEVQRNT